jgi:hypothetical protein
VESHGARGPGGPGKRAWRFLRSFPAVNADFYPIRSAENWRRPCRALRAGRHPGDQWKSIPAGKPAGAGARHQTFAVDGERVFLTRSKRRSGLPLVSGREAAALQQIRGRAGLSGRTAFPGWCFDKIMDCSLRPGPLW